MRIQPPDRLHTVWKGNVEMVLRWSIAVIFLFHSAKDLTPSSARYVHPLRQSGVLAILDDRIKNADIYGPFSCVGEQARREVNGLSEVFKDNDKTRNALASGTMTGGCIDAIRIVSLLYHLALSIGEDDLILPDANIYLFEDSAESVNIQVSDFIS
jgi:hypothetical protein